MDLEYGPQYEDYKKEVQAFCDKYKGIQFSDTAKVPLTSNKKSSGPSMSRSDWQKTLIENGYFARSIPKEYGGFGGESDVIKSRIAATEFSNAGIPVGLYIGKNDKIIPYED